MHLKRFSLTSFIFSSVQFSRSVASDSLRPHELQHARPPSITNSQSSPKLTSIKLVMPSSHLILCHPLSSHLQSFPASRSFSMSQFLTSGGQSIGVSAPASVLPMNIQDWFPLGWTGWISLLSKGLSRVFSNTTVQKHQYTYFNAAHQGWAWLHMDITTWSTLKSDRLYCLQPKMEKLYTVNKNKTGSWLWLTSWTPYGQIQT